MSAHGIGSHKELGEFIGVAPATATRLLHGERVPKQETLDKIADKFEADVVMIRELAERPLGERQPFVLPREFDQLTASQRNVLIRAGREYLIAAGHRRVTRS